MADNDQSLYNLRFNQVTSGLEGFGGGSPMWTPLSTSSGGSTVVASVALINQVADISATTLFIPSTSGVYRISSYSSYSAGDGATDTAASLAFNWTDIFGAQTSTNTGAGIVVTTWSSTIASSTNPPTAGDHPNSLSIPIQAVAGQPIQYTVSGGTYATAAYYLYIVVEKLA